jgi:hypothetical protein
VKLPLPMASALLAVAFCASAVADEAALGIKVRKQSGIAYISGGLGDQAKAFEQVAPRYPVQLLFTQGGEHTQISGVKVTIRDVKGDALLEAVSEGPLFYANTSSGRWTFEVEYGGETITRTKDLTGRRYLVLDFDFKKAD